MEREECSVAGRRHLSGSRCGAEEEHATEAETVLALLSRIVGEKLDWWTRGGLDCLMEESKTVSIVGE